MSHRRQGKVSGEITRPHASNVRVGGLFRRWRLFIFTAMAGLLVSFSLVLIEGTASATSVSTVVATPALATTGATTSYDISFETSATGSLAAGSGTIVIDAPATTTFSSTPSDYFIDSVPVETATLTGSNEVTLTLPSDGPSIGDSATVTVWA
ncbi:MAG TPA: hypothetical protein VEJ84_08105, partial [Acidimicrobiales bacterium]|nr:hypothetical protein [Acidimicrobiales bacterium]